MRERERERVGLQNYVRGIVRGWNWWNMHGDPKRHREKQAYGRENVQLKWLNVFNM